jgi:hypothetical protein
MEGEHMRIVGGAVSVAPRSPISPPSGALAKRRDGRHHVGISDSLID